jgi:hypothetical protein
MEKKPQPRSNQQNKAIHVLFRNISDVLNEDGLDVEKVLSKKTMAINWTDEMVKELLWRPAQMTMFGKKSTTELTTAQIDQVFAVIHRFLTKLKVEVEFPSIETLINQERGWIKKK